jgi:hypothetical protein
VREYLDRLWETTLDNFTVLAEAEAETDRSGRSPSTTNRSCTANWRGGGASTERK